MKLSIWQQFSSNNSASYIIVGVFETPSDAQKAKSVFNAMIVEIAEKRKPTPPQMPVSPWKIQKRYAETYGVEWNEEIEWLNHYSSQDQEFIDRSIILMDHHLMIAPHVDGQSWHGEQIQALLTALGSEAYLRVNRESDFRFRLLCTAPTPDTAVTIYEAFATHLHNAHRAFATPSAWAQHLILVQKHGPNITTEQYASIEQVWQAWHRDLSPDEHNRLLERWREFVEGNPLLERVMRVWSMSTIHDGHLIREELQIILEETRPQDADHLDHMLLTMRSWLESLGCNVTYEFVEYGENADEEQTG